jgi:RNA polymerase sigma-70 factor (ECF subfamily)
MIGLEFLDAMAGQQDKDSLMDKGWRGLDQRYRVPLRSYFRRRVLDPTDAEDLTQEVFVRLAKRPDQHNGETIDAYVFKIAANVLTDWNRYRTSRRAAAHRPIYDQSEFIATPQSLVEDRDPERVLAGKDALKDIEDGLAELSERTREIFLLSRMENIHHRVIANLYGISISAVEKHVIKAVAHLSAKAFRT